MNLVLIQVDWKPFQFGLKEFRVDCGHFKLVSVADLHGQVETPGRPAAQPPGRPAARPPPLAVKGETLPNANQFGYTLTYSKLRCRATTNKKETLTR